MLNPKWVADMQEKIAAKKVDVVLSANLPAQWLIASLARANVPYEVYQLGAGVKRITTDTEKCPCCKRKL